MGKNIFLKTFGVCFRSSRRTKNTRLEATFEPTKRPSVRVVCARQLQGGRAVAETDPNRPFQTPTRHTPTGRVG